MSTQLQAVPIERNGSPPADPASEALAIIRLAVEHKVSAEELRALVELQRGLQADRARQAYNEAMAAAQAEMPAVLKDADNPQTRSRYARRGTIITTIQATVAKHGFSISFYEGKIEAQGWKRIMCDVGHRQGHTETRWIDLPVDGIGPKGNVIGGMNALQGCGSTFEYGCRYLTCGIFNVPVLEDVDGNRQRPITADELKALREEVGGLLRDLEEARQENDVAYTPESHEDWYKRWLVWLEVKSVLELDEAGCKKAKINLQGRIARTKGG